MILEQSREKSRFLFLLFANFLLKADNVFFTESDYLHHQTACLFEQIHFSEYYNAY